MKSDKGIAKKTGSLIHKSAKKRSSNKLEIPTGIDTFSINIPAELSLSDAEQKGASAHEEEKFKKTFRGHDD